MIKLYSFPCYDNNFGDMITPWIIKNLTGESVSEEGHCTSADIVGAGSNLQIFFAEKKEF